MDVLGLAEKGFWALVKDLSEDFGKSWVSENKKTVKGGGKVILEVVAVTHDTASVILTSAANNINATVTLGNYGYWGATDINDVVTFSHFYDKVKFELDTDTYFFETALLDGRSALADSNLITGSYYAIKTMAQAVKEGDSEKLGAGIAHAGLLATSTSGMSGSVFSWDSWSTFPTFKDFSLKPCDSKYLDDMANGNKFDDVRSKAYPYNQVYIDNPKGGYYILDSYNPTLGEIVSRKFTQLSNIKFETALKYIKELAMKYPANATIAKVKSSDVLAGKPLLGQQILEIPPQLKPVPPEVIMEANKLGITIRDTNGKVYK